MSIANSVAVIARLESSATSNSAVGCVARSSGAQTATVIGTTAMRSLLEYMCNPLYGAHTYMLIHNYHIHNASALAYTNKDTYSISLYFAVCLFMLSYNNSTYSKAQGCAKFEKRDTSSMSGGCQQMYSYSGALES
jgi:hypothetical protein